MRMAGKQTKAEKLGKSDWLFELILNFIETKTDETSGLLNYKGIYFDDNSD